MIGAKNNQWSDDHYLDFITMTQMAQSYMHRWGIEDAWNIILDAAAQAEIFLLEDCQLEELYEEEGGEGE